MHVWICVCEGIYKIRSWESCVDLSHTMGGVGRRGSISMYHPAPHPRELEFAFMKVSIEHSMKNFIILGSRI